MQNDLISRSALLKEFEKRQEQQTNKYCDCFLNDAQELSTEWWCVEDAVIAAPTIDAVEVVRCKDCKHAIINHNHIDKPLICCLTKMVGTTDPDWFCAAGERKDGGEEV